MKRRLVVIDNFLRDPGEVRDQAMSALAACGFQPSTGYRPIPGWLVNLLSDVGVLKEGSLIDGKMWFAYAPDIEPPWHGCFDGGYLLQVFLTPDAPLDAGVSFLRSRRSSARSHEELETLEQVAATFDGTRRDTTAWDEVDRVANVYNRAVLWDARLFTRHTNNFGVDAGTARLVLCCQFDVHAVEDSAPTP